MMHKSRTVRCAIALGLLLPSLASGAPSSPTALPCPSVSGQSSRRVIRLSPEQEEALTRRREGRRGIPRAGGLDIDLVAGTSLSGNISALLAFTRAIDQWEARLTDPITVTVEADFGSLGAGKLGIASSTLLVMTRSGSISDMKNDAADESDDGIVDRLPAGFPARLPSGFSVDSNVLVHKALLKAQGATGVDASFGATDVEITFNEDIDWDFDNGDGVTPGYYDFETVVAHELGHALGFSSIAEGVDALVADGDTSDISPYLLDFFRFPWNTLGDPSSYIVFRLNSRELRPGREAAFDDVDFQERRMSTGEETGDGRQASHWKDDDLIGRHVGIMDPTLETGAIYQVEDSDVRALDVIGWDVEMTAPIGTTSTTLTTVTTTTQSTTTTTLPPACEPEPDPDCHVSPAGKSRISLTDKPTHGSDKLSWKMSKVSDVTSGDFSHLSQSFSTDSSAALCIYDDQPGGADIQPLVEWKIPSQAECSGQCWESVNYGIQYQSTTGAPDGMSYVRFKGSSKGTGSIKLVARGEEFVAPPLPLRTGVIVQVILRDGAVRECWQATYSTALDNDESAFKAKSD